MLLLLCLSPFCAFADDGASQTMLYPSQYIEEKYGSFVRTAEKIFTQYPGPEAGYSEKDDMEMRRLLENIPLYRQKINECQRVNRAISKLAPAGTLDREYFKLTNMNDNFSLRIPEFKARSETVSSKEKDALRLAALACTAPTPASAKEYADKAREAARGSVDAYRYLRNMFDWGKLKQQRNDVAKIDGDLRRLEKLGNEYKNAYAEANDVYQKGLKGGSTYTYFDDKRRRLEGLINTLNKQYQELTGMLKSYLDQPWGLQMMNRAQRDHLIAGKILKDFPQYKEEQYLFGKINVLDSPERNGCERLPGKSLISSRKIDDYYSYLKEIQSVGQQSYAIAKSAQDHAKRALECAGQKTERPPSPPSQGGPASPPPAGAKGCRPGEHKCDMWCCQLDVQCFSAYSMKMAISQGRCRTP